MRLAYLDAFAGVSGDMLLGAFVHAGVPVELLQQSLARLDLGATLKIEKVDRSGIHAIKVHILTDGKPADRHDHLPATVSHHSHHHAPHDHEVRFLGAIRDLIAKAGLPEPVEALATRTFELLGAAEAKIHDVPIESIHFHEVGAVDAIADIVLAATAAHALWIEAWHCSPLNVGGGTVQCAHGRFPVPAPATAELLRNAPTYSSGIQAELVTPTGAALVRALGCTFGPSPPMKVDAIGYGAGTRNPPGFANVVRLSIGEATGEIPKLDSVVVMEVAVDDLNPQVLAYVAEQALVLGALDVMCTPVFMKKNRPGTLLTVLSDHEHASKLEELLLRETSTLGLRIHEESRVRLQRKHVSVATEWGPIRVKVGHRDGREFNAAPEFDDCRALAESNAIPVKRVLEAALQAYRKNHP
jgi:pyridinium-3,5-bisthiocarboxylic acid mononucleotide nickel chelatase